MKYFYKVCLLIIFFLPCGLFTQQNSIEQQIQNYEFSKPNLISKGRKLLLDNFMQDSISKVREIMNYFKNEIDDEYHFSLFSHEKCLLGYWTNDYSAINNEIMLIDSNFQNLYRNKIGPQNDVLFYSLRKKSKEEYSELVKQIQSSNLSREDKDFGSISYLVGNPTLVFPQLNKSY